MLHVLALIGVPGFTAAPAAADDPFAPILHMLDYLGVDYPEAVKDGKVADQGEYDEQVEFAASVSALIRELPHCGGLGDRDVVENAETGDDDSADHH